MAAVRCLPNTSSRDRKHKVTRFFDVHASISARTRRSNYFTRFSSRESDTRYRGSKNVNQSRDILSCPHPSNPRDHRSLEQKESAPAKCLIGLCIAAGIASEPTIVQRPSSSNTLTLRCARLSRRARVIPCSTSEAHVTP